MNKPPKKKKMIYIKYPVEWPTRSRGIIRSSAPCLRKTLPEKKDTNIR